MLPYFWYILKVIICSGILFGYYWLFLRNKIFHQYNRFYLLIALSLSLLLPMIKIDFWQQDTQQSQVIKALQVVSASDDYMNNVIITATKNDWSIQQLYPVVYWAVSFIFLLILLQTLFIIRSLLKRYPVKLVDQFSFVNTDDKSTPFSFFKYIFWNANIDMDTATGKQIFKHEVAHIQEKHTHDKLFVNIILIFFWCNPFFWLYRKELNMIHEFIADKKAVEDSDTASFAAMILQAAYPQHRFQLTNNFFYSPIKRRLLMLTKNNNPRVNYLGRVMVLPLLVLIFAAFTFKAKTLNKLNVIPQNTYQVTLNKLSGLSDTMPVSIYINAKHAGTKYLESNDFKKKALVIVDSKEIGNLGIDYIDIGNMKYSTAVIYNPLEAGKIYGEKGQYGVIKLTKEDATFITADSVFYNDKTQTIKLSGTNTTLKGDFSSTLIYVDGKIVSPEELNAIPPSKVSSISILKGEKLDGIIDAQGKTALINVSLKPDDLAEVVVTGYSRKKETPVAIVLDKMNVFYIAVENQVNIAADVPNDKLLVSIDKGSIRGSNGKYIVTVTQVGEAIITVATVKNNKKVLLGTFPFSVKVLPDQSDPNFPNEFRNNIKIDNNRISSLNQNLILHQQNKLKLAIAEKTIVDKKMQEQEVLYLNQKLSLLEQQNKANLDFAKSQIIKSNDAATKVIVTPRIYVGEISKVKTDVELFKKQKEIRVTQGYSFVSATVFFSGKGFEKVEVAVLNETSLSSLGGYIQQCTAGSVVTFDNIRVENANRGIIAIDGLSISLYDMKTELKATDAYIEKAILYEKELQAQQNNLVFTKTEVSPQFTGGDAAWRNYLQKNLNANTPLDEGWKSGKYTVIVKFIVHTDGTVTDVTTENYKSSKTAKECIRIITNAPKWLPAIQNGKNVNAYKRQPITFVIE
ncbi:MAG: M56 family metallopeptidase [Ferruginibacter sp.]